MAKRKVRQGEAEDDDDLMPFVRAARSAVGTSQDVVQRIGTALIGGDYSGNVRGEEAVDIQGARVSMTEVAGGERAIAFGAENTASGTAAVAIGVGNVASTIWAITVGKSNQATGSLSVALGVACYATAVESVAVGLAAQASGAGSTCLGISAAASGARSVALGCFALASLADEAVIAGTMLRLQIAVGVKVPAAAIDRYVAAGETFLLADRFAAVVPRYFAVDGTLELRGDAVLEII